MSRQHRHFLSKFFLAIGVLAFLVFLSTQTAWILPEPLQELLIQRAEAGCVTCNVSPVLPRQVEEEWTHPADPTMKMQIQALCGVKGKCIGRVRTINTKNGVVVYEGYGIFGRNQAADLGWRRRR